MAKVSKDGVESVAWGREKATKNGKFAGSSRPVERADGTVVNVPFTEDGFADFSSFVVKDSGGKPIIVEIEMKGNWGSDFAAANKKAGFGNTDRSNPAGTTWHHSEDRKTMMLVPGDIHSVKHTCGVEMIQRFGELP